MKKHQYIMRNQVRDNVTEIMQYDLTWRQKKLNTSTHLSIIFALSMVSVFAQVL